MSLTSFFVTMLVLSRAFAKALESRVFSSLGVSLNSYLYTMLGPSRVSLGFMIVLAFFSIILDVLLFIIYSRSGLLLYSIALCLDFLQL